MAVPVGVPVGVLLRARGRRRRSSARVRHPFRYRSSRPMRSRAFRCVRSRPTFRQKVQTSRPAVTGSRSRLVFGSLPRLPVGTPRYFLGALTHPTVRLHRHARGGATTRAPHRHGPAFARRPGGAHSRRRGFGARATRAADCRASTKRQPRSFRFPRPRLPNVASREGRVVAERARCGRRVRTPRDRSQGRARQDRPHVPRVRSRTDPPRQNDCARLLVFAPTSHVSRPNTSIQRVSDVPRPIVQFQRGVQSGVRRLRRGRARRRGRTPRQSHHRHLGPHRGRAQTTAGGRRGGLSGLHREVRARHKATRTLTLDA